MRCLLPFLLLFAHSAMAQGRPVAAVQAERFDTVLKTWQPQPLRVFYQAAPESVQAQLLGLQPGQPLTLRLDFKHLPHFDEWLAQRRSQGGATWAALQGLLAEVGDGPAIALVQEPLKSPGPILLKLGLRQGARFKLYATVQGSLATCGSSLCFQPEEPDFASKSAALAWKLLKPLARSQAKTLAQR